MADARVLRELLSAHNAGAQSKPVATGRVTHLGYAMELSTYVAYSLPMGMHDLYAQPQPMADKRYTYASTQATNCAVCGEHKHTPLRIDRMGGYVCLTCIDRELESITENAGAQEPVAQWQFCFFDGARWSDWGNCSERLAKDKAHLTDDFRFRALYEHAQPQMMTDAARNVLTRALTRYDELMGSIQGCTDGGCLIRTPRGMHTNSGCRCHRDSVKTSRAMYAANELRKALAEIGRGEVE